MLAVSNAIGQMGERIKLGELDAYHVLHGYPIGKIVYGISGALNRHLAAHGLRIGAPEAKS